jgi:hypothetical protein
MVSIANRFGEMSFEQNFYAALTPITEKNPDAPESGLSSFENKSLR